MNELDKKTGATPFAVDDLAHPARWTLAVMNDNDGLFRRFGLYRTRKAAQAVGKGLARDANMRCVVLPPAGEARGGLAGHPDTETDR